MKHLKRFNEDKEEVIEKELTPSERIKKYQKLRKEREKESKKETDKGVKPVVVWP